MQTLAHAAIATTKVIQGQLGRRQCILVVVSVVVVILGVVVVVSRSILAEPFDIWEESSHLHPKQKHNSLELLVDLVECWAAGPYCAFVPPFVYAMLGTSPHASISSGAASRAPFDFRVTGELKRFFNIKTKTKRPKYMCWYSAVPNFSAMFDLLWFYIWCRA